MKVLIDMPNIPKNDHQRWVLTHGGIVLDGLTNGEVIKLMFPNMCVEEELTYAIVVKFYKNGYCIQFDKSWWNAKWGE